tara:strand:+ start:1058 stop:1180 length:123 start_codon:yes stop_codon:yes gene_type:complete
MPKKIVAKKIKFTGFNIVERENQKPISNSFLFVFLRLLRL